MSLDQLVNESAALLAPTVVRAVRPTSLEAMRDELRASNRLDRRYVVNFSRAELFGRGGGHHSPLGGFLEREDLAFVLDVNRRFGPWLVSPDRLFAAIDTVANGATGSKRGLARFELPAP